MTRAVFVRCSMRGGFAHNRDSGGLGEIGRVEIGVLRDHVPAAGLDEHRADEPEGANPQSWLRRTQAAWGGFNAKTLMFRPEATGFSED